MRSVPWHDKSRSRQSLPTSFLPGGGSAHGGRSARAFTLVELLVVITIIGILIALLLPAVQSAREAAHRAQCENNVKQLGVALHVYHNNFRQFPPGYGMMTARAPSSAGNEWPWCVRLLPYIEQQAIAEKVRWNLNPGSGANYTILGDVLSAQIESFLCPSDRLAKQQWNFDRTCYASAPPHGRISYAGNFGQKQLELSPRVEGVFRYNTALALGDITDGTTNTLLVSELAGGNNCTIRGAIAYDEGPVFMQDHGPNDRTPDLVRWCDIADSRPDSRGPCAYSGSGVTKGTLTQGNMVLHTSRSVHPGGVMSGMCDGSARFIRDTIALKVWQKLGTPDQDEVVSADEF